MNGVEHKPHADIEADALNRHAYHGNSATYVPRPSRIGNPGALGLFSFASTTFMLSMYNVHTRGIKTPNTVVGMALFAGGLVQLLAGMWEFPRGNVFGATAFSSYGAFWLSYASLLIPGTGISSAYASSAIPGESQSSVGIFLITWFMVTFFFLIASLRKSMGFIALFSFLTVTFLLLAVAEFVAASNLASGGAVSSTSHSLTVAGGAFGIATAFVAYYIALSELLASDSTGESWRQGALPTGAFTKKQRRA